MPNVELAGPRISTLQTNGSFAAGSTNGDCHVDQSGVNSNEKAVIANARVVVYCWGSFYDRHPDALTYAEALCKDLVTGPFLNGLAQYGVGRGSVKVAGRFVDTLKAPPATLSEDEAQKALLALIKDGLPEDQPSVDETSLMYVVFLPPETRPTILSKQDDFCGYHNWAKFNDSSTNADVFYAIIRTDKADQESGKLLIDSVSYCVSHEIGEMLTNRDGRGYHNGKCEIGDLCEQLGNYDYRGWQVEQYWSQWDNACIKGDSPVSLRRFLSARGITSRSLKALQTQVVNIEFIASQFR